MEPKRFRSRNWPAIVLVLFVVYVLSLGPVVWLAEHKVISHENAVVVTLFAPLQFAAEYCPPLGIALRWYVSLFGGH